MKRVVQSGTPPASRAVRAGLAWAAWLLLGVLAFDLPQLLGREGGVLAAFEAAPPRIKTYVGIWVLGSVALCALFLRAVQKLGGSRHESKEPHPP